VIQQLGGGGFGNTYEVDDSGTKKVLKVLFNIHPKAVELFQQEAEVLKRLNHPGVPKVESDGYFTYTPRDSQQPLHCLVMEKIEGLNLEEYLIQRDHQPIGERAAVRWLKQLVEILHTVHQQQYFHRDIKPPNIMLRPGGQLVLIDFGTAREVTQTFMQKVAGQQVTGIMSPGYTPSEQMNGKAVPQSDFFALGRTFVYLLTGKSPQEFPEHPRTGELIWRTDAVGISQKLLDFIDYLMAPFPGNRPRNTQDILQRLADFETSSPPLPRHNYIGFGKRLVAYLIDTSILTLGTALFWKIILSAGDILPSDIINYLGAFRFALMCTSFSTVGGVFGLFFLTLAVLSSPGGEPELNIVALMIAGAGLIIHWLYFTLFESSTQQATLGKKVLNIVVTDENQNRLSFAKANQRYWGKTLSGLILLTGFIMAGFTKKKQALHDKIARTIVIDKK